MRQHENSTRLLLLVGENTTALLPEGKAHDYFSVTLKGVYQEDALSWAGLLVICSPFPGTNR